MQGLSSQGQRRRRHRFIPVMWLWLLAAVPPRAFGYFMGDTKAVLNGCEDHWTLQNRASVPLLFQMTVCVDIRVVVPGAWVAFSYSSVHAPRPELGLEGDEEALYGWLLRVRHRFPLQLSPTHWHRVCLRRDIQRNSFSLKVNGTTVSERTVIARAIPPSGSLVLGCRPRDRPTGAALGEVELYLFRMWADLGDHGLCEDGTVIGWNTQHWGLTSPRARQTDPNLQCAQTAGFIRSFTGPSAEVPSATATVMKQTSQVTGSSSVNCDVSQLCSNKSQDLCEDMAPSSGRFMWCTSTSSLDEICQADKHATFTCSVIEPISVSAAQPRTRSCSREGSHFCDSTAFSKSAIYGLPVHSLPTSNLTWVASYLLRSDVCQLVNSLLPCGANERLAILLTDSCVTTTQKSTTQPSTQAESAVASTPEASPPATTVTGKPNAAAAVRRTSTSQPHTTASFATTHRTRSSTARPVLRTSSPNVAVTRSDGTAGQSAALSNSTLTPTENTTPQHTTPARQNATFSPVSSTATALVDLTPNTTVTTVSSATTANTIMSTAASEVDTVTDVATFTKNSTVVRIVENTSKPSVDQTVKDPVGTLTTRAGDASLTSTATTKPGTGTTTTPSAETTETQDAQEKHAKELLDRTQDASQLNSSQVAQLAEQLEKLLAGPTVSQAVGHMAVNIISNLMEGDSAALSASANRLIQAVDELGVKLVVAGDSEIVSSKSLVLAVAKADGTNFSTTSVDIFNTDDVQLRTLSRSRFRRSGSALGSVFLPSSLTTGLSPEQQQQASRVQITFYTKSALFQDAALDKQTLVSPVLGSSVANLSLGNLTENIQFTIRSIYPIHANYAASCAFWDFTLNGGGGGWSSAGCSLVSATLEETTCSCNHLTSFAILLDLSREGTTDQKQAQALTFITYIGCGISAVFVAATLLTYLSFGKLLRDIPAKILVQLCISLLLLNLVFLLDGWLALYPVTGLCIGTAFFLHYFLLTSFTWAGLEALHMYLSVVRVFTPYLSRYMLKFSLVGWGFPLVVVIVVISVDKDNYGLVTYGNYTDGTSDEFCWLRKDVAFYVGVVAYFLLVFVLCLLVFIMVMVQLARIKKQNPQNQSPNRGLLTDLRSIAGLVILLGLTWGFALFAWGPLYIPFVFLFSIFNSLQGFLVFVFHCAAKEKVRRQWRTHLCCGRLRLAENSDWSQMATQNNKTTATATATTSAPHLNSRSSSVISDGTNSSGSVFADSGISDGCSTDVILNEIHRQKRSL